MAGKIIIFDLDDVLMMTIQWYWARWEMFKYVMSQLGFGQYEHEIIDTLNSIDGANVERNGFEPEAFGWAMGETYGHYCAMEGRVPDEETRKAIEDIGHSVFVHRPILYPGVKEALGRLREGGHVLYCITKGDVPNQTRKVREAGLEAYFEEVIVVPDDKAPALRSLIERHQGSAGKSDVYFVGNSLRSDMLPAIEEGVNPVWVPCYTWPYEEEEIDGIAAKVIRLSSVSELPGLVESR